MGPASVAWMERERNPGWDAAVRLFPGFHFVASGLRRYPTRSHKVAQGHNSRRYLTPKASPFNRLALPTTCWDIDHKECEQITPIDNTSELFSVISFEIDVSIYTFRTFANDRDVVR